MQILDETLDLNKSKQYKMSILIQKGGLSFIILDSKLNKVIAYKHIEIEHTDSQKEYCYFMNKVLNQEELVKSEYDKVEIIYQSFKSVMVPSNFYSEENKKELFELNLNLGSNESIVVNPIKSISAVKMFAVPNCIIDSIKERFADVNILHQTTGIIRHYLKEKSDDLIVLNVNIEAFDIQIYKNKKLLLDNSFKYQTKEDFLYYLLFTMEQLNLEPKTQNILYYTDKNKSYKTIQFAKKYFGELEAAEQHKACNFTYLFSKEDINKIMPQILAFQCE